MSELDRDKARDALIWMQENGGLNLYGWDDCLNRLEACVTQNSYPEGYRLTSGRDVARQVHDVVTKWTARGYIVPEVTTNIEDDLQAVFRGEV